MAVWQENLSRLLLQKEVLILHGNVRDTSYVRPDGTFVSGLTPLLRDVSREHGFHRAAFYGVYFDHEGKGTGPMWSVERVEHLRGDKPPVSNSIRGEQRELVLLNRWLSSEIASSAPNTVFSIYYIDKITPYSSRGAYSKDIAQIIILIQKIIENISPNNRLILVALQDTMLPLEYYTNSPRVAVLEIPIPGKDERHRYFSQNLARCKLPADRLEFLANITDGLYMRDMENILRDVAAESEKVPDLTPPLLRKVVNRYRIGSEADPWAGLPLSGPPKGLLDSADNWFLERVVGQDHAVSEVVRAVMKARAGVVGLASGQEAKPKAVFFLAGPTGVGKTFLAKKLAEYLFDTEEAFIRFDMSEFKEDHTVSKLIGAPPGYVGYEKGGELTNAVKSRPFSVILFDEIEKAHPKIMDIFLQMLDDGRLTDSRGQTVFFTESVIIFTSNLGTRTVSSGGQPVREKERLDAIIARESDPERRAIALREHFVQSVREFFTHEISRPELLNRIGSQIIAFNYIAQSEAQKNMLQKKLRDIEVNFRDRFSEAGHRLEFGPEVAEYFHAKYAAQIERFGGRGLVHAIDGEVGHLLAKQLLLTEKLGKRTVQFQVFVNDKGELRCMRKE